MELVKFELASLEASNTETLEMRTTLGEVRRRMQAKLTAKTKLAMEYKAELSAVQFENRELKRANQILREASAYFAQAELDRRRK